MRSTRFFKLEQIKMRNASSTITSEHLPMITQGPFAASFWMIFDWITKSWSETGTSYTGEKGSTTA